MLTNPDCRFFQPWKNNLAETCCTDLTISNHTLPKPALRWQRQHLETSAGTHLIFGKSLSCLQMNRDIVIKEAPKIWPNHNSLAQRQDKRLLSLWHGYSSWNLFNAGSMKYSSMLAKIGKEKRGETRYSTRPFMSSEGLVWFMHRSGGKYQNWCFSLPTNIIIHNVCSV